MRTSPLYLFFKKNKHTHTHSHKRAFWQREHPRPPHHSPSSAFYSPFSFTLSSTFIIIVTYIISMYVCVHFFHGRLSQRPRVFFLFFFFLSFFCCCLFTFPFATPAVHGYAYMYEQSIAEEQQGRESDSSSSSLSLPLSPLPSPLLLPRGRQNGRWEVERHSSATQKMQQCALTDIDI